MSNNKQSKRGPKPTKRNKIILKLREKKRATSRDLKVATAYMTTLASSGLVSAAGKVDPKGGSKGRKAIQWKLTPRGNGKASALIRAGRA